MPPPGAVALAALLVAAWVACASPTVRREALLAEQPVSGVSGRYEVVPTAPDWYRVPAGTVGDSGSDLELGHQGGPARLVVYVDPGSNDSLDSIVRRRRARIAYEGGIATLSERRFFLKGSDHVAASLARYAQPLPTRGFHIYWVMTVRTRTGSIEAIGLTNTSASDERVLHELVSSLRVR